MKILSIVIFFLWSFGVNASEYPRIGDRVYVLDHFTLYDPVLIKGEDDSLHGTILRDPIFPLAIKTKVTKAPVYKKPAVVAPSKPYEKQEAKLGFTSLQVVGRISKPRISFKQKPVRVDRVDEEVSVDFLGKIFEDAKADKMGL